MCSVFSHVFTVLVMRWLYPKQAPKVIKAHQRVVTEDTKNALRDLVHQELGIKDTPVTAPTAAPSTALGGHALPSPTSQALDTPPTTTPTTAAPLTEGTVAPTTGTLDVPLATSTEAPIPPKVDDVKEFILEKLRKKRELELATHVDDETDAAYSMLDRLVVPLVVSLIALLL